MFRTRLLTLVQSCSIQQISRQLHCLSVVETSVISAGLTSGAAVLTSRRAQLRWAMIRDGIKKDWWKYASTLTEGSIRWRAWFEQWRMAGRYVLLRNIMLYHVGFEEMYDAKSETITYAVR